MADFFDEIHSLLGSGIYNINDIRAREDLPPTRGGDRLRLPHDSVLSEFSRVLRGDSDEN